MRRGKERWTQADDKRLGRALLAVYAEHGEAVVTSDMCALWRRVQYFYQDLVTKEKAIADIAAVPRSARSLHTRWARDIRPEMLLYASIVDRLLQAGWKAAQALREASSRFQAKRRKVNTEIMRQFALDRKRADVQQVESEHPRLKFESFHYRHCYDVLHMNPRFVESLLCHKNGGTEGNGDRKRRRPPIGDSDEEERYSTGDSETGSHDDENHRETTSEPTPTDRLAKRRASTTSKESESQLYLSSDRLSRQSNASSAWSLSVALSNGKDSSDGRYLRRGKQIVRSSAHQHVHPLQQEQRLKLLAELRAVVATIAQLTQQVTWHGVASAALTSRMGGMWPSPDEDVMRDIALFRQEKWRLKQQLAELDGDTGINATVG